MPHDRGAEENSIDARESVGSRPSELLFQRSAQPGGLVAEFRRLTESLLGAATATGVLEELVCTAVRLIPGADVASVALHDRSEGRSPVATDPVATELDGVQYDIGAGPCLDATASAGPAFAISNDLGSDGRWPEFTPVASRYGFRAVLATGLLGTVRPPTLMGALNVYSRKTDVFTEVDRDNMLLLGTHASLALATATAELQLAQLRQAVDSRDVIGQAKGILMHWRGISAEEAFELLSRASQDMNIKLADVAKWLTEFHDDFEL